MITPFAFMQHGLAQQVGWALLHSLWQGALIGAGYFLVRMALRGRSANAAYLAGCVSLALLLAAPIMTVVLSPAPSPDSGLGALRSLRQAGGGTVLFGTGHAGAYGAVRAFQVGNWGSSLLGQLAPWLSLAWVLGVAFYSIRLTRGCWQVWGLRTRETGPAEPAWLEMLQDLQCRLGITRPVRLVVSTLVEVPTVVGWLRPVILVPALTLVGLAPAQVQAILAHELAHVRRLDYLVNAFQCVVETLMFYHPVARWVSRCIREERENACDDLVVAVCGDRVGYARALATLEEMRVGVPALAFAANGGSLLGRVRRLLGVANDSGRITAREVSGLALLGIGLLLVVLGVSTLLSPSAYRSVVRIRVERDRSDLPGMAASSNGVSYDPYFIQTEFEVLQCEAVLGEVVKELDLNRKWGDRYAAGQTLRTPESLALLRSRMEIRPVRNTSLIEVRVFSDKPKEAAAIANAVAQAYSALRHRQLAHARKSGINVLEERLAEQEAKVRAAEKKVEALRVELNIHNPIPLAAQSPSARNAVSAESAALLITADTLRKIEATRMEHKAEYVRQSTMLSGLLKLQKEAGTERLAEALATAAPDTLLVTLQERQGATEEQLVGLRTSYGPDHAEVVKTKAVLEALNTKIKSRVEGVMRGLETRVLSISNSLQSLQKEVEQAVERDREMAERSQPYFASVQNLEELRRFRQVLATKVAAEKIDTELPSTALAEVVDAAAPSLRPVSPNVPRAVALIVLGLSLDLVGLRLLKSRRSAGMQSAPA